MKISIDICPTSLNDVKEGTDVYFMIKDMIVKKADRNVYMSERKLAQAHRDMDDAKDFALMARAIEAEEARVLADDRDSQSRRLERAGMTHAMVVDADGTVRRKNFL